MTTATPNPMMKGSGSPQNLVDQAERTWNDINGAAEQVFGVLKKLSNPGHQAPDELLQSILNSFPAIEQAISSGKHLLKRTFYGSGEKIPNPETRQRTDNFENLLQEIFDHSNCSEETNDELSEGIIFSMLELRERLQEANKRGFPIRITQPKKGEGKLFVLEFSRPQSKEQYPKIRGWRVDDIVSQHVDDYQYMLNCFSQLLFLREYPPNGDAAGLSREEFNKIQQDLINQTHDCWRQAMEICLKKIDIGLPKVHPGFIQFTPSELSNDELHNLIKDLINEGKERGILAHTYYGLPKAAYFKLPDYFDFYEDFEISELLAQLYIGIKQLNVESNSRGILRYSQLYRCEAASSQELIERLEDLRQEVADIFDTLDFRGVALPGDEISDEELLKEFKKALLEAEANEVVDKVQFILKMLNLGISDLYRRNLRPIFGGNYQHPSNLQIVDIERF